jgi:hypothetical protein
MNKAKVVLATIDIKTFRPVKIPELIIKAFK